MSFEVKANQTTGEVTIAINTVDRYKLDAAGNLVLLNSAAKIIGGVPLLPPGAFQLFQLPAAPDGWIVGNGTTIGSAASGATRANADTLDLFTAWWAYTDAQLPIYLSVAAGGALSSRGTSAAADWNAGKRLTVFDARDRVARAAGTLQANGTKLEATEIMVPYGVTGVTGVMAADQANGVFNTDGAASSRSVNYSTWGLSLSAATPLSFTKMRVASLGMLGCYKL